MLTNRFSRRNTLSWLGANGLSAAFLVGTQTKAKADDEFEYNKQKIITAWLNTFYFAKDPATFAALYTNDGIFEDVPNGFKIQSPNNIKCFVQGTLKLFGNFKIEILSTFTGKNKAVAEYIFTATNTGLIPVPSTLDKSFTVRTLTVFDLKGNKIERSADYYDNAAILGQLGLIPPLPAPQPPSCQ